VTSLFDTRTFNERLFFPRPAASPPPAGALDLAIPGDAVLHVRWHRRDPALPTVLLFHGNGEVVADYDDAAPRFAAAGANLAVMDYRGYGQSGGTPTLRNTLADAGRVLDAVRAEVAAPLVIMGRSLGSACAAELYGASPAGVLGVVLESGFVDLSALIRRRGLQPPAALPPADLAAFDPGPKLARGRLPLLVLHGSADTMIAPAEAERALALAGSGDKQLVLVPDRGHNEVALGAAYWAALAAFIARLSPSRAG
jgi:alpha-beta hydrolase superfamily lysophospholipase